jgi:fibronectin type 3 domain-containing protein
MDGSGWSCWLQCQTIYNFRWTIATNVPGTSYLDTTVTNGTTYYYVVTAVDSDGNESANSNEASATLQAPNGQGLLRITMNDSSEREYKLSVSEIDDFVTWFNRTIGTGTTGYVFNKTVQNSKEYLSFEKIISFEVIPLTE